MVLLSKYTFDAILFYFVLEITAVKCLPLLSAHWQRRLRKMFLIRRIISCGKATISWQMASFNCSIDRGRWVHTFDFRYPLSKKSSDRAGQPINAIKWPGNISLKIPIDNPDVWALSPSCWSQTLFLSSSSSNLGLRKEYSNTQYRSVTVKFSSSKSRTQNAKFCHRTRDNYARDVRATHEGWFGTCIRNFAFPR